MTKKPASALRLRGRMQSSLKRRTDDRWVSAVRSGKGDKLKLHRVGSAWPTALSHLAELNPINIRRGLVAARRIDRHLDVLLASRNLHAGLSHRGPLLKAAGVNELQGTRDVLAIDLQVERT